MSQKVLKVYPHANSMARRVPQNRQARDSANAALRAYGTQRAAAKATNVSLSTFRKALGKVPGRVRDSTASKMSTAMATDDLTTMTVDEALDLVNYLEANDVRSPLQNQTLRAAQRALDKAEAEGKGPGDTIERPKLKKGVAEWRLGRGKSVQGLKAWEQKMRKKGFRGDLQSQYDEATGYTRA